MSVLGPLQVRWGHDTADVRGVRLQTLVAVLALSAGQEVSRSDLAEALWGEEPPNARDNALQALVSRLRRAVPAFPIRSTSTGYRLEGRRDAVDALRFESLVGSAASAAGSQERAALLRDALALWRGPALSGLAATQPVSAYATRYEELRRTAVERRIDDDLAAGRGTELVAELSSLVSREPLREKPRAQLMRALQAAGRQVEALTVYEEGRTRLGEELGIDPSDELHETYLEVLRGEGRQRTAPPAPSVDRRSLPAPLTDLVGRDADVERIRELLAQSRLVTVVGPGGVGKTRVAIESARRFFESDTDPVWLAEFAAVADPAGVPRVILDAIGANEGGLLSLPGPDAGAEASVADRIARVLGEGRALLILDNCEHVAGTVAKVAQTLLARCPRLRVLAASRQSLAVSGERMHPLPGLALPQGVDDAPGSPAVRLFVERAAAVRPAFALDERTTEAVVAICRALDGLPLALELAAARMMSFSADQLRDRLDDRFQLLEGDRGADERRQRTLRATMDWSWELLDDAERTLAARMSVFGGSVGIALIERVCAGSGMDANDLDRLLASLVAKSVVQAEEVDGRFTCRTPETIRLYTAEKLAASGEEHRVRSRHAHTLLEIAESAEPKLRRLGQEEPLSLLASLADDFHAALHWSVEAAPPEVALRMVAALEWFWLLTGRREEGTRWTRRVLALPAEEPSPARAVVCTIGGLLEGALLGRPDGLGHLREALSIVDALAEADHPVLAAVEALGPLAADSPDTAQERLQELAAHEDPWIASFARSLGARMLIDAGLPDAARRELLCALSGFRTLGDRFGLLWTLPALAELESARNDHAGAVHALDEALRCLAGLGAAEDGPVLMTRLAAEYMRSGDPGRAEPLLHEAVTESARLGLGEAQGVAHHALGDLRRHEERLPDARHLLDLAYTEIAVHGVGIGYRPAVLVSQGHLAIAEGRAAAAADACTAALDLARQVKDARLQARVVVLVADLALARGRAETAAALLRTAADLRGQPLTADPDTRRIAGSAHAAPGDRPSAKEIDPTALDSLIAELAPPPSG